MLATTTTTSKPFVDDVTHRVDKVMCTTSEEELGVMAYLLTQYNLKPGLRKFGTRGEMAALKEMTQLHIMDTWTPMEAEKLSREQRMRALSSLTLPKGETNGGYQGEGVYKWSAPACIHPEGGCGISYRVNGIDVHYCNYCSNKKEGK